MNEIKYSIHVTTPSGDSFEWDNTTYPTIENNIMKFRHNDNKDTFEVTVFIGAATVIIEEMEK